MMFHAASGFSAPHSHRQRIAVVGSGVSGLSAAWLLSKTHDVVLYEAENRIGGHANTVDVPGTGPVDTGFIVYNEKNYPNFTAMMAHLGVESIKSQMSFSASLDQGNFEYCGEGLTGLLAQKRNAFRPRFWALFRDLLPGRLQDADRLLPCCLLFSLVRVVPLAFCFPASHHALSGERAEPAREHRPLVVVVAAIEANRHGVGRGR